MDPEEGDAEGQRIAEEMNQPSSKPGAADEAEASEEIEQGSERSAALEQELQECKERVLRLAADFENFRKRAKREQKDARVRGREEVLIELLTVFDNLERATEAAATHADDKASQAIVEGVAMVQKQFADGLGRFELEQFSALGKPFDPNYHEAISQMHSEEHPPGVVVQEYQKGYVLGERLLRAAMVVVAAPSSTGEPLAPEAQVDSSPAEEGGEGKPADEEGSA